MQFHSRLGQYDASPHLNFTDYVSETNGEGGDILQLCRQPGVGVREDTRVVGRCEELPEFHDSSDGSKAHPGVRQYGTGNYLANISISASCSFFKDE